MNEVVWDGVHPLGHGESGLAMARVLYAVRQTDGEAGQLLEAPTMEDFDEDFAGGKTIALNNPRISGVDGFTLDALVTESQRLERVCTILQRVLSHAGDTLKVSRYEIGKPRTFRGQVNVVSMFVLSDGQAISIYFHSSGRPRQLDPKDELISWKWLLNKKDVTIVVAPERGKDLNLQMVGRRVMALAEKNSDAFARSQANAGALDAEIARLHGEIAVKEATLSSLHRQLVAAGHEIATDSADAAPPAMTPQPSAQPPIDARAAQDRYLRDVLNAPSQRDQDLAYLRDVAAGRIDVTVPDIAGRLDEIAARHPGVSAIQMALQILGKRT
jgi:hypothetical protein